MHLNHVWTCRLHTCYRFSRVNILWMDLTRRKSIAFLIIIADLSWTSWLLLILRVSVLELILLKCFIYLGPVWFATSYSFQIRMEILDGQIQCITLILLVAQMHTSRLVGFHYCLFQFWMNLSVKYRLKRTNVAISTYLLHNWSIRVTFNLYVLSYLGLITKKAITRHIINK